jgi:hypothetical protein
MMDEYTGGSSALQLKNKAGASILDAYTPANAASLIDEGPAEKSILPKIIPLKKKVKKDKEEEERVEKVKKAAAKQARKQQVHMPIPEEHKEHVAPVKGEIFDAEKLVVENEAAIGSNVRLRANVRSYLSKVEHYLKPNSRQMGRKNIRIVRL